MNKLVILLLFLLLSNCSDHQECTTPTGNCALTPDPGLCKAYFIKYYYDQNEKRCKEFVWGGCGGVVPFETLEACQSCEKVNRPNE